MKTSTLLAISIVLLSVMLSGCSKGPSVSAQADLSGRPKKTMRAFKSDGDLKKYLKEIDARQKPHSGFNQLDSFVGGPTGLFTVYDGSSITNVQHAGVDEGGIVKLHGDHLVILRRGRLFTINVAKDDLKPISVIDAFDPDIDPKYTWYDELLISGDTIMVIGYSYERGGTEVLRSYVRNRSLRSSVLRLS